MCLRRGICAHTLTQYVYCAIIALRHFSVLNNFGRNMMLEFRPSAGGLDVFIDEKLFGRISKEHGFFTGSSVVKGFLVVSPEDLIKIAQKADEVRQG